MMSVLVLTCVSMLSALVAADVYYLGGCDLNFDNDLDPLIFTQEGVATMKKFFESSLPDQLYAWNPSSVDKTFTGLNLIMDLVGKSFYLQFQNSSDVVVTVTGTATIERTPKTMLKLFATNVGSAYLNFFSFNEKAYADLYPLYISSTDVILRGCNPAFLGRRETLYVFTNQDYASLDPACSIQTIKTKTGWTTTIASWLLSTRHEGEMFPHNRSS